MWVGLSWGLLWAALGVWLKIVWFFPLAACGVGDALWFWRGYFWGTRMNDGKRWRYGDPK
jgi:membrane protein DedA with SNARE-associated domain